MRFCLDYCVKCSSLACLFSYLCSISINPSISPWRQQLSSHMLATYRTEEELAELVPMCIPGQSWMYINSKTHAVAFLRTLQKHNSNMRRYLLSPLSKTPSAGCPQIVHWWKAYFLVAGCWLLGCPYVHPSCTSSKYTGVVIGSDCEVCLGYVCFPFTISVGLLKISAFFFLFYEIWVIIISKANGAGSFFFLI